MKFAMAQQVRKLCSGGQKGRVWDQREGGVVDAAGFCRLNTCSIAAALEHGASSLSPCFVTCNTRDGSW